MERASPGRTSLLWRYPFVGSGSRAGSVNKITWKKFSPVTRDSREGEMPGDLAPEGARSLGIWLRGGRNHGGAKFLGHRYCTVMLS